MTSKESTLRSLRANQDLIAEHIVDQQLRGLNFSESRRQVSIRDATENIRQLADAIELESQITFNGYIVWLNDVLKGYGFDQSLLIDHLTLLVDYIEEYFAEDVGEMVRTYVFAAIAVVNTEGQAEQSFLENCGEYRDYAQTYLLALIEARRNDAVELILSAVNRENVSIEDLYIKIFTNVLYEIGRLWQSQRINVGQEHFATVVTQYIMSMLYEKIFTKELKTVKMMGVCVGDELHEIGIRMVCDIFEMNNWDSYYLGANVPLESIIGELERIKPQVLALSATTAHRVPQCIEIIKAIKVKTSGTKIIVGGRPFNMDPGLWVRVGADGHSVDAVGAVKLAQRLVNERV